MPNEIITEAFNEKISLWNSIEAVFAVKHDIAFSEKYLTQESDPNDVSTLGYLLYYGTEKDWRFFDNTASLYENASDRMRNLTNFIIRGSCIECLTKDARNIGNIIRKKFRDSLIDQVRGDIAHTL